MRKMWELILGSRKINGISKRVKKWDKLNWKKFVIHRDVDRWDLWKANVVQPLEVLQKSKDDSGQEEVHGMVLRWTLVIWEQLKEVNNWSETNQDNWGLENKTKNPTQAEAKAYTSEKEFWKKLSLHFYFRPEKLWGCAVNKNGVFKKMVKEVVDIFGKERFNFWKTKLFFLTVIFKPQVVWHEVFVKFLLNWKRDSKLL